MSASISSLPGSVKRLIPRPRPGASILRLDGGRYQDEHVPGNVDVEVVADAGAAAGLVRRALYCALYEPEATDYGLLEEEQPLQPSVFGETWKLVAY